MLYLKQSTAVTLKIGPFLDSTDGNTAETGLTISQADVRLSKNGGNMAQKSEATSATHDELGLYDCPLDATDTNTLGRLELAVHETGALIVRHTYMVIPAQVWDSLFGADLLQVDVGEISSDATAANNAESFFDGTGYAGTNNVIPSVTTVTGNVNGSVGSVTGAVGSVTGAVGSVTAGVNVTQVNSLSTGVTNFQKAMVRIDAGQAVAGTLSTTQMTVATTDLPNTTTDAYKGRLIRFDGNITAALKGQETDITASILDGANVKLTYTAMTNAPAAGDTWVMP